MRSIKIPLDYGRQFAIIDLEDRSMVMTKPPTPYQKSNWNHWTVKKSDHLEYAVCAWKKTNGKWTQMRMHRLILGITNPKILVDHRNGNGLDCRKKNLRICNQSQNMQNMRRRKPTNSGFKGVSKVIWGEKYQAYINYQGRMIHLGFFKNKLYAAKRYNQEAKKLFGEFACLNQI